MKRWVMTCGCRTPESSVWMWKRRPRCLTLLLNPSSGDCILVRKLRALRFYVLPLVEAPHPLEQEHLGRSGDDHLFRAKIRVKGELAILQVQHSVKRVLAAEFSPQGIDDHSLAQMH